MTPFLTEKQMNELIKNKAQRINDLHKSAILTARKTIELCIEAGEILNQVKNELKHGQFNNWCNDNLELSRSTIFRYMKLFNNKELVEEASTPSEALNLIDKCSNLKHLENKILFQITDFDTNILVIENEILYPFKIDFRELSGNWKYVKRPLKLSTSFEYVKKEFFTLGEEVQEFEYSENAFITEYLKVYKAQIMNDRLLKPFNDEKLSLAASSLLARCNDLMSIEYSLNKKNLGEFNSVLLAFKEIRDNELYREEHGSFKDYCSSVYGLNKETIELINTIA